MKNKKIIFICFGRRNNYLTANFFAKKKYLKLMVTDFYLNKKLFKLLNKCNQIFNFKVIDKIILRYSDFIKSKHILTIPSVALDFFIRKTFFNQNYDLHGFHLKSAKFFNKKILNNKLIFKNVTHLYSYRNDSLELFVHLKKNNSYIKKILEVPVAPAKFQKNIINKVEKCYLNWEPKVNNNKNFNEMIKREKKEIQLADHIIAPSKFVKDKILSSYLVKPSNISIIPYAMINKSNFKKQFLKKNISTKIKVLTVGDVCLRKGVHHVYEIAKALSDKFEFTWVGKSNLYPDITKKVSKYINLVGETPNNRINQYYNSSDIYFLPSLCEGSAISLYEAYKSNLFLIFTKNCGFDIPKETNKIVIDLNTKKMISQFKKIHADNSFFNKMSIINKNSRNLFSVQNYEDKLERVMDKY
ncbi:glycosyltransferase [Candidatus Pelagibacter giovannonii]|uniref:Glycosyltransferase n=1 Tax=Candidatus Pelagibacter giovannonii TaxID=2563896 RepID=A0A6H1Q1X2_9PROT|nr:glycosyltransferase [Candidatus Pelagibacter giovannonii]QIZ20824.1 glycosyltransferase [Candidatus Pelagibacter giovannonii]